MTRKETIERVPMLEGKQGEIEEDKNNQTVGIPGIIFSLNQ